MVKIFRCISAKLKFEFGRFKMARLRQNHQCKHGDCVCVNAMNGEYIFFKGQDGIGAIYLSVMSGVCGTVGSLFGKLASNAASSVTLIDWFQKLLLFMAMISFNTTGVTLFANSLVSCKSSLPATVVSAATNYFCSALVGFLFFHETTSIYWWFGTFLILLGLITICYSSRDDDYDDDEASALRDEKRD